MGFICSKALSYCSNALVLNSTALTELSYLISPLVLHFRWYFALSVSLEPAAWLQQLTLSRETSLQTQKHFCLSYFSVLDPPHTRSVTLLFTCWLLFIYFCMILMLHAKHYCHCREFENSVMLHDSAKFAPATVFVSLLKDSALFNCWLPYLPDFIRKGYQLWCHRQDFVEEYFRIGFVLVLNSIKCSCFLHAIFQTQINFRMRQQ